MGLEHLHQVVAKLAEDTTQGRTSTNHDELLRGFLQVNPPASKTTGMDGGPRGYNWRQELPDEKPATSGRVHGLETLSSGSEKIVGDENGAMLDRLFTNMDEARRVDRDLVAKHFDEGKTGKYVTRSKTLLQISRDVLGE